MIKKHNLPEAPKEEEMRGKDKTKQPIIELRRNEPAHEKRVLII